MNNPTTRHAHMPCGLAPLLWLLPAAAFLALFSTTTSPLCSVDASDSVIYKLVGLGIANGRLPYANLFDNKGPLLYLIESLGHLLSWGRWGLFLIQTIGLATTLWFTHRALSLLLPQRKALWATLITLVLMGGVYQGGNHVEEYMLPFISISFYYALRFFNGNDTSRHHILLTSAICGIAGSAVAMLRPNDAAGFFGGLLVGLFIMLFRKKEYTLALHSLLVATAAALVAVAPVLIWLVSRGALDDMFYAMFETNRLTKLNHGLLGQFATMLRWGKMAILLLIFVVCAMAAETDRRLLPMLIPIGLLQLLLIGHQMFAHYFIPLLPLLALYIAMLFRRRNAYVLAVALAVLLLSHRPLPRMALSNAYSCLCTLGKSQPSDHQQAVAMLQKLPAEASVWNYNLEPYWNNMLPLLYHARIVQCNRGLGSLNDFAREYDLAGVMPDCIVACGDAFSQQEAHLASAYREGARCAVGGTYIAVYLRADLPFDLSD